MKKPTTTDIQNAAQLEAAEYLLRMTTFWYPDNSEQQETYAIAFRDTIDELCCSTFNSKPSVVKGRLEELLIKAFEHAVETSEQATEDLIRATGITQNELEAIGYEKENFPSMHKVAATDAE